MTTVVPFKSETITGDDEHKAAETFGVTADELKARRSEIALLEARCGEVTDVPPLTGWQRWLLPFSGAAIGVGFALALQDGTLAERGLAGLGIGIWGARVAEKTVRAMRLSVARKTPHGRRLRQMRRSRPLRLSGWSRSGRSLSPRQWVPHC